ncbi:uncharacterized protein LOC131070919 [Cryptomeria japonica]|uniref:uncharacterized protein LOC131070919 n=1 Tax=Cryptomeria japonica TaxID=3369 RepID=UPI0027DA91AE|nr:uncharacterized protein LOC131070919 [Cryptomeria japonica]
MFGLGILFDFRSSILSELISLHASAIHAIVCRAFVAPSGASSILSNKMNNDLFLALETGNVGTLENFRQQFFNVLGDVTFQGDTPLHIAARKGHVDLVTWIFQLKPSLAEAVNKDNNTPLHEAAKSGNRELVRILLRGQNYVYCFNKFGETALMIASRYRHVEIVRILLQARSYADAFEWDKCLGEAAYKGYNDVLVALLEQVPARPNLRVPVAPILHTAVRGGHLQIVQAMLEHASWENKLMIEEDELGRCAIHVAAVKGNWDIINEFISRMPDCVEIRSSNNKSVLHFAVEHNQLKVVKNLLKNNGNEKVVELVSRDHDISRNMSLHFAAKNAVDPQMVEYLVAFPGVDVNAVNDEGMTALDIASEAA